MTNERRRWLVLLASLGLAGVSLCIWLAPSGGINRMSVLRIKAGMSHEEVDAVIGLSHGDHRSNPDDDSKFGGFRRIIGMLIAGQGEARFWYGDAGTITVWFDDDGKVTKRYFRPSVPSFIDKVYQWVGVDFK